MHRAGLVTPERPSEDDEETFETLRTSISTSQAIIRELTHKINYKAGETLEKEHVLSNTLLSAFYTMVYSQLHVLLLLCKLGHACTVDEAPAVPTSMLPSSPGGWQSSTYLHAPPTVFLGAAATTTSSSSSSSSSATSPPSSSSTTSPPSSPPLGSPNSPSELSPSSPPSCLTDTAPNLRSLGLRDFSVTLAGTSIAAHQMAAVEPLIRRCSIADPAYLYQAENPQRKTAASHALDAVQRLAERTARNITLRYEMQLLHTRNVVAATQLGDCAALRTAAALVLLCSQAGAPCLPLEREIHELRTHERLAMCVGFVSKTTSPLMLTTVPIATKPPAAGWTDDVLSLTGIRTNRSTFYGGPQTDAARYGYRWGTEHEATLVGMAELATVCPDHINASAFATRMSITRYRQAAAPATTVTAAPDATATATANTSPSSTFAPASIPHAQTQALVSTRSLATPTTNTSPKSPRLSQSKTPPASPRAVPDEPTYLTSPPRPPRAPIAALPEPIFLASDRPL